MNLAKFIDEKFEWSLRVIGPGQRTVGIVAHISKELGEILDDPASVEEWVDVILLALDGASRVGFSGDEIVAAMVSKQAKNCLRQWPEHQPEHQSVEHVREEST